REAKKRHKEWGLNGMGKNWLGIPHLDYLDLASWIRKNPTKELPYWVCHPSYGKFPSHTLVDFGFKPWQEFIAAMIETKRAFAAVWVSNGPGELKHLLKTQFTKIKRNQSMPAFTNASFDRSPQTKNPRGPMNRKMKNIYTKKLDMDFVNGADREGGINIWQRWDTTNITDKAKTWEMTIWLAKKCPVEKGTMDITPRRCQKFKAKPGQRFKWQSSIDGKVSQSGTVKADKHGFVTLPKVAISKKKCRIRISR
ncbi:MAG: hypothetical protein HRT89_05730, partial [Lentisphaeria bacterium]|nr:hypothetical protein [Lentisphaeria bacterium]